MESRSFDTLQVTHQESVTQGDLTLTKAEAAIPGDRVHQRYIGESSAKGVPITGKPVLYIDRYGDEENQRIYAYARHIVSPKRFFELLNGHALKNRDLLSVDIECWTDMTGELERSSIRLPLKKISISTKLTFFRVALPGGGVSIEFGGEAIEQGNQLDLLRKGQIIRGLEAPLFAADFTRTTGAASLLAELHWAGEGVMESVQLLAQQEARGYAQLI
jgi:hypothetical protein